jgi:hypothetical protein
MEIDLMDLEMQTTSVVIVGTGFSAAASDGKMPLMTGFFDQLTKERFPELFEFVSEVGCSCRCPTIARANVERIQGQLTSNTLNRLKLGACVEATNWADHLLACCGLAITVISMNYGNLAELNGQANLALEKSAHEVLSILMDLEDARRGNTLFT